jgi:hypothetical protein
MEKMYYNNREIVLVQNTQESNLDNYLCHGCALESENNCVRVIIPPQGNNVCCPRNSGKFYIFKFEGN